MDSLVIIKCTNISFVNTSIANEFSRHLSKIFIVFSLLYCYDHFIFILLLIIEKETSLLLGFYCVKSGGDDFVTIRDKMCDKNADICLLYDSSRDLFSYNRQHEKCRIYESFWNVIP